MPKGKKKPRRSKPRPDSGYLWLLLALPLFLGGCGMLDWATGAGDETKLEAGKSIEGSPIAKAIDAAESTGPIGAAAGVIASFLAGGYVARRRAAALKEKAKEAVA